MGKVFIPCALKMRSIFPQSKSIYSYNRKKLRLLSVKLLKIIDKFNIADYYINNNDKECERMRISYKKLWILLIEKDISPATLRKDLNIATGTMTKMRKNEEVALSVLLRICEYLDCNIGDICDAVKIEDE